MEVEEWRDLWRAHDAWVREAISALREQLGFYDDGLLTADELMSEIGAIVDEYRKADQS